MDTVRLGLIGIGNMGSAHLSCIAGGQVRGLRVDAVCDIDCGRLDAARSKYPHLRAYDDPQALIADGGLDAVLIAVPHRMHAALGIRAFSRGLHVLCEKPLDVSITQAQALIRAAEDSGRVFGIMLNQRTDPLFARARQLVQSGELGALHRTVWIVTNWLRSQRYYDSGGWRATWRGEGGGVLLNQAPHQLDLWQWICGMPTALSAVCDTGKYHRIEVEDDATILARFANGATGVFVTATGDCPGTNRLEIDGERGKLVLEHGELHLWQTAAPCAELIADAPGMSPDGGCTHTVYRPDAPASAHRGILQNFTDAVLHGTPLLAPGADGLNELMLSNAAYLSAWQGGAWVDLPPDGALFDRLLEQRAAASAEHGGTPAGTTAADGYSSRWSVNW